MSPRTEVSTREVSGAGQLSNPAPTGRRELEMTRCSHPSGARLPVWVTSGLLHCSKRRCYSIISAARIADRPSSLDIGSHSFSCLKLAFLIPIQGRPSQSFIYDRRCGRINYQSGGPAPSSIFRQLSYGKLFEDFFAFSLE